MTDDIFEQISQGGGDEETAENRRIHEVADELRRRCQLYEAQSRGGKENVIAFETEQRVTEQYAKDNGLRLPLANIPSLGVNCSIGSVNDNNCYGNGYYNRNISSKQLKR